jgi:chromosome segregation ATPase
LILLLPLQSPLLALSWQDSGTPANDCDGLAKACSRAAKELKAARELIAGYESEIAAADARIELALKQIDSLRKLSMLSESRAQELETVIAAEREAKSAAIAAIEEQKKRIANLEKKAARYKKFALIAGTAAAVAILVGVRN